jgi:hypothetical protein
MPQRTLTIFDDKIDAKTNTVQRQLLFPIVLPHEIMLPGLQAESDESTGIPLR